MILLFVTPGHGQRRDDLAGRRPDDGHHDVDDGRPDGPDDQHPQAAHQRRAPRLPAVPEPDPRARSGSRPLSSARRSPGSTRTRPSLWSVAMSARLWERRPAHPDFADIRIGTGPQLFAVKINPMQTKPVEDLEPLCARALRRFISAHATVADQPVAVFLRSFAQIFLTGDPDLARAAARAVLTQLFTFHAPDDLRIAACCSEQTDGRLGMDQVAAALAARHRGRRGRPGSRAATDARRDCRPVRRGVRRASPARAGRGPEPGGALRRRHSRWRRRQRRDAVHHRRIPERGLDRRRRHRRLAALQARPAAGLHRRRRGGTTT